MRLLASRIRILAFVQLLLALPLLGGSTVCIPLDGTGTAESGLCVCTVESVSAGPTSIGQAGTAECGPCRDVTLSCRVSSERPALLAPAPAAPSALSCMVAGTPATPVAAWFGESPGNRLPILRC
jgi:hypothetical protein